MEFWGVSFVHFFSTHLFHTCFTHLLHSLSSQFYRKSSTRLILRISSVTIGLFSLGLLIWGICGSTINDSSLGSLTWATRPAETKITNLVGLNGDTYVQDLGVYFTSASLVLVQPPAFPLILTWGTFLTASLRKTYKATIEYSVRGLPGQYR